MSERQMSQAIENVEISHVVRYLLARSRILPGMDVLDIFCGTGYGSKLMADIANVTAVDKFNADIKHPRVKFIQAEYPEILLDKQFEMITCFESIEHIPLPLACQLLKDMRNWLKPGGTLFISSPNELNYPFDPEKISHHCLHYTPKELEYLLNKAGFKVINWFHQKAKFSPVIEDGPDGRYMIAECV